MSGVALLAKAQGFEVSGCDLESDTPYLEKIKKAGVTVFQGHDQKHLEDIDILAVTPAAYFQSEPHPEVVLGKQKNIMTWQSFLGNYLHKDKRVICVAGTHGKSTTTSMLALLFEEAKKDPWVMVGATVPSWQSNARVGSSDIFVTESDEFFDNFLNYKPSTIILNNIEYDHPDYFSSYSRLLESFAKHVQRLVGEKTLIVNQDSEGVVDLFNLLPPSFIKKINVIGYTLTSSPRLNLTHSIRATKVVLNEHETSFFVNDTQFTLGVSGEYNISNALGVIIAAQNERIPDTVIQSSLQKFKGIGRRMEELGENSLGAVVYDDYAHHPTAISETLKALRQKHPDKKILAIIEPHTFSRTKALLHLYEHSFSDADSVIVTAIFKSRDTSEFGISGTSIVGISKHPSVQYMPEFERIVDYCKETLTKGDVVVVMGAGNSYKLARLIQSI